MISSWFYSFFCSFLFFEKSILFFSGWGLKFLDQGSASPSEHSKKLRICKSRNEIFIPLKYLRAKEFLKFFYCFSKIKLLDSLSLSSNCIFHLICYINSIMTIKKVVLKYIWNDYCVSKSFGNLLKNWFSIFISPFS